MAPDHRYPTAAALGEARSSLEQQTPPLGPFFCPWNRFSPRLVGVGLRTPENAPVSQILTLANGLQGKSAVLSSFANLGGSSPRVSLV